MNGQEEYRNGGTLNVIFHGSMAIYDSKEGESPIHVLLPKNGPTNGLKTDHHVYRAGNWLGETERIIFAREAISTGFDDAVLALRARLKQVFWLSVNVTVGVGS